MCVCKKEMSFLALSDIDQERDKERDGGGFYISRLYNLHF